LDRDQSPSIRQAEPADAGRKCPYCRFPFKAGVELVVCGTCSAAHHAECWADNGGCAIAGCASAPVEGRLPPAPVAAPAPPVPVVPARPAAPAPGPRRRGGGPTAARGIAVAAAVLAVAVAAGAFVLINEGGDDGGARSGPSADAASADTVAEPDGPAEAATTRERRAVTATVARTCGSTGDGDCFLSVHGRPTADSAELDRLDEGTRVRLECQRIGGRTSSSVLGGSSYVWSRMVDGGYVASVFLEGAGLDPFQRTLPRCD
jgi:hypothetical protein